MPYSPTLRLVHVAIPKTGTTSVIRALADLDRANGGGGLELLKERVGRSFRARHGLDALGDRHPGRAKHLSAEQLRAILGPAWDGSFAFSFVRNPWARAVSRYHFTRLDRRPPLLERLRRGTRRRFHQLDFRAWLEGHPRHPAHGGAARCQLDKLSDREGTLLVDFVGRLEDVQAGFAAVCERVGVAPVPVPHVNGTGTGRRYVDFYDPVTRDLVSELYRRDIEAFGYAFGD